MGETAAVEETVVEQETTSAAPVAITKGKSKKQQTGNLILDIAHEIEALTKVKALNEAENLATDIEVNYFRLGGVLLLIQDNSWYEGFSTFDDFVFEKYGFQGRKGRYLMDIYKNLVDKQIPWDKVSNLGWTKLKDLASIITLENLDEWVAKAEISTVAELQQLIKLFKNGGKPEESEVTTKTKSDWKAFKVMMPQADLDLAQQALAKAKGELNSNFDNVALAGIFANYLGNSTLTQQTVDLDVVISKVGIGSIITRLAELHPEYDISIDYADSPEGKAAKAAKDAQAAPEEAQQVA